MRARIYGLLLAIILFISAVTLLFTGFSWLHFVNAVFTVSLILWCLGLFLYLFSDGAFSIMGHSFRRFHYVMAPKRIKETMKDDELYTSRDVTIRNEKYMLTLPLIVTSFVCGALALIISYLMV
ncbi:hypothetical protein GCM10007190_03650 [Macrococcus hajekii]|nr:DUF3899 domain-containing protein [Macrococcus hajekii]GGA98918.1 hypothetical protein GCM10007190_03650 [Macrococcus hajekii]